MAIRVAVVGAGRMGRTRLDALANMENVEIAGICDIDPELAEKAALTWGGEPYINHRTMIEREEIDALFVCLPPFAHADVESVAARAGRHLFIERPVALTIERAAQVAEEIADAGVISAVGHTWRYLSGVDEMKAKIGDRPIALASGQWFGGIPESIWRRQQEKSGGLFLEQASDIIDMARMFCGEIERLFAVGSRGTAPAIQEDCTLDDAGVIAARFHRGAAGSFAASCLAPSDARNSLRLYTGAGSVAINWHECEFVETSRHTYVRHAGSAIENEVSAFIHAVETGERSGIRSDYNDALNTLKVSLAAARAVETRRVVEL